MTKEFFDVLNEEGNKTGETKLRSKVHRDGDWHRAVHIWILNSKAQLLLQKRGPHKDTYPNHWTFSVGGHLEAGTTSEEAVTREAKEELGLDVTPAEARYLYTIKNAYEDPFTGAIDKEFNDVYLIEKDIDLKEIAFAKDEVTAVQYFDYKKLQGLIERREIQITPQYEEYKLLFEYLDYLYK